MLSNKQKIDLVSELVWLATELEESGETEELYHEVLVASQKWDQLEEYLKQSKKGEESQSLKDDFEAAQISYVVLRELKDGLKMSIDQRNKSFRSVCNMLDIDYFGDLQNLNEAEVPTYK